MFARLPRIPARRRDERPRFQRLPRLRFVPLADLHRRGEAPARQHAHLPPRIRPGGTPRRPGHRRLLRHRTAQHPPPPGLPRLPGQPHHQRIPLRRRPRRRAHASPPRPRHPADLRRRGRREDRRSLDVRLLALQPRARNRLPPPPIHPHGRRQRLARLPPALGLRLDLLRAHEPRPRRVETPARRVRPPHPPRARRRAQKARRPAQHRHRHPSLLFGNQRQARRGRRRDRPPARPRRRASAIPEP